MCSRIWHVLAEHGGCLLEHGKCLAEHEDCLADRDWYSPEHGVRLIICVGGPE